MSTSLLDSFSFGAPHWLWSLLLLPALFALVVWNAHRSSALLHKIVAPRLAQLLTASVSWPKRWVRFFLQLAALALLILSAAQPRFGYTWEESKRKGRDVLFAVDVSKSMLSTDVTPNRLTRAKLAAEDLAGMLRGDRVGVIAFAGNAFLQAPLTADSGAVLDSLRELDPNIIPVGGTNIAEAIKIAVEAFGKGESDNRALVLFSDGEEIDADGIAAARKQAENFRIFTVGIGTKNGSLIPLQDEAGGANFVKDEHGQFVKSRLDEDRMQKLAEVSGGFYVHLENGPADMQRIMSEGLKKLSEHEIDAKLLRHPIERYQWPLGFGMVLLFASLLLNERRRAAAKITRSPARVAALAGVFIAALTLTASARNEGVELYEKQQYKEAAESFQKTLSKRGDVAALHFDLGAAAYKAGDYGKAMESFSRALAGADPHLQPKAEYNLGNTLYQRGAGKQEKDAKLKEWRGAVQHYEQALKLEPENSDAKYNRDLVKKLIEELEKPQQEQKKDQKQDQQKQQEKDKQKQDKDQQSQQQENKGGQKQDSKQDQKQQNKDEKDSQQQKDKSQQDAKNQEQKKQDGNDSNQDSSDPQKSDKKDSGKDKKPQESKPENKGDKSDQGEPQQPEKPDPANAPPPSDKKFEGDVRTADQQPAKPGGEQQEAEIAEGEVKEGEMSKGQALSLLESAKSEDAQVTLTERKRAGRVVKDW